MSHSHFPTLFRRTSLTLLLYTSFSSSSFCFPFPEQPNELSSTTRQALVRELASPVRTLTPHTEALIRCVETTGRGTAVPAQTMTLRGYVDPGELMATLGRLPTTVTNLTLALNRIHDVAALVPYLARLTGLRRLSLQDNLVETWQGVRPLIEALPNVQDMDLRGNFLRGAGWENVRDVVRLDGGAHATLRRISLGQNCFSEEEVRDITRYASFEILEDQRVIPQGFDLPAIPAPRALAGEARIAEDLFQQYVREQDKQSQRARDALQGAVDLYHPQAMYEFGRTIQWRPGTSLDNQAFAYFREAAEAGLADAQYEMAIRCRNAKPPADVAIELGPDATETERARRDMAVEAWRDRNWEEMVSWLKQAAVQGHIESWYTLGITYGNEGLKANRDYAVYCFTQAARRGNHRAQRRLATLYSSGSVRDLPQALSNALAAGQQKSTSARAYAAHMYSLARQSWHDDAESFWWAVEAVTKRDEQGNKTNELQLTEIPNATFLLGRFFEKGIFVPQDLKQARIFYQHASSAHSGAQMRLAQLDRGGGAAPLPALAQDQYTRLRHTWAQDALTRTLAANPTVATFRLQQDYESARRVAEAVMAEPGDGLRINIEYLWADPYLAEYGRNVNDVIADEDVTRAAFDVFFTRLTHCMRQDPAFPAAESRAVQDAMERIRGRMYAGDAPGSQLTRKRVLRLFRELHPDATDQGAGQFGMLLFQNSDRCRDGLDTFLDGEEARVFRGQGGDGLETIPLGGRISRILNQERESFIEHYIPAARVAREVEPVVANRTLLRQRMRLALGLTGELRQPLYPQFATHQDDRYSPETIMERFLRGGSVVLAGTTTVVPEVRAYDARLLVSLLRQAQEGGNRLLRNAHLDAFIRATPQFDRPFREAIETGEANEFFDFRGEGIYYTDRFFEELLVIHGYLVRGGAGGGAL